MSDAPKAFAVLTSGGDAPGMNAALRAAVKLGHQAGARVLGVKRGYEGLISGDFEEMGPRDVDAVGHLGGTVLGSARCKAFTTPEGRLEAAERLKEAGIGQLLVIGGNGSLTGAHALASEHGGADLRVMGVPASIDNDIGCTSTAIGVDTALNTIVDACDRISDTARAHHRVFIVEVMGRQCGYLAMAAAIAAGADAVLFREQGKDEDTLLEELQRVVIRGFDPSRGKRRVLIIKAEGVEVSTDALATRLQSRVDKEIAGVDVRATVLGHLVRGGNPSYQDRMVAQRMTFAAVHGMLKGATDQMIAWLPWSEGGEETGDPVTRRFGLARVLEDTAALLDGSSDVTKRRLRMLEKVEGVLSL